MDEVLKRDQNRITVLGGITDDANQFITMLRVDPVTKRLLVSASGAGAGTVTSITAGTGLTATPNPITTTGTIELQTSLQPIATLGTAGQSLRVNAGETALEYYTPSAGGITIGTTTITSGTNTRILYNNAGVVGEYTLTGSGTVAVMQNTPTLTTPVLGVATATSINKVAITAPATSATLTIADGKTLTVSNSLTLAGTDSTVITFPTTSATIARTDAGQTFTGVQVFTTPTITTANFSGAQQLAEGASIRLDASLSADGTFSGTTIAGTAGATLAFGDLIYLAVADSRWELVDADSVTTCGAVLTGMCVLAAASDGDPTVILLRGNIRADANFPALTVGAPVYASTSPGDIQVAQPSGTDDVIQVVGFALTADSIIFNPSPDYITHV